MMDVPENRRPVIHTMGQLFQIGEAHKERLEDRKTIGRTGKYRGNNEPYDPWTYAKRSARFRPKQEQG